MRIHPALSLAIARDFRLAVLATVLFLISVPFLPTLFPVLLSAAILAAVAIADLARGWCS
jgi:hypothetical protein